MSSPVGYQQIQGIIKGISKFDSASEGDLYIEETENKSEDEVPESGPKRKLKEDRLRLLNSTRITPEKPKKRRQLIVKQTAEPFRSPVRIDTAPLPQEVEQKYWNKKI